MRYFGKFDGRSVSRRKAFGDWIKKMSYQPKTGKQEDLENMVSKRIDEMLGSIKSVSTMYVEPGDVVVVKVSDRVNDQEASKLQQILGSVFNKNKGVFLAEDIDISIVKRGEIVEDVEKTMLREQVADLERRLRIIEAKLESSAKDTGFVSE
jgi:hypothetical protein